MKKHIQIITYALVAATVMGCMLFYYQNISTRNNVVIQTVQRKTLFTKKSEMKSSSSPQTCISLNGSCKDNPNGCCPHYKCDTNGYFCTFIKSAV